MLVLVLAAFVAQTDRDPRLVGDWAAADAFVAPVAPASPCATDFGVTYAADGSWRSIAGDERGIWHTKGDRLGETVTHMADEMDGGEKRVRRRPTRARLQWLDADHLNVHRGRTIEGFARCPAEPASP